MDEFFTKTKCDRCGRSLSGGRIMSRFNTDCLCVQCEREERQHPDYGKAAEAELAAVRRGDTNVTPQCDTYRGKVRRGSCCFFEKICGWLELVQRRCGSLPVLWKKRFDLSPRPTARSRAQRGRGVL